MFDTTETTPSKDMKSRMAKLTYLKSSILCSEAYFGHDSDYMARIFGNFLYAIDAHSYNLHVYSLKDKLWNFSPLKELGV
jgi:hypothetical protein